MGTIFFWNETLHPDFSRDARRTISELVDFYAMKEVEHSERLHLIQMVMERSESIVDVDFDLACQQQEIGKRSAAGLFCWDCKTTLAEGGIDTIHSQKPKWADSCPICGKAKPNLMGSMGMAARVELGFDDEPEKAPEGISTCCSFTWNYDPDKVKELCQRFQHLPIIRSESFHEYTGEKFMSMLNALCPIYFKSENRKAM